MKKIISIFGLVGLFLLSFVVFLYLTFPYEVLKETLSVELSGKTGFNIQIGELNPRLPLGIQAIEVHIDHKDGAKGLHFNKVIADVSILSLFVGSISTELELDSGGGQLDLETDISISDLIAGTPFPNDVTLEAQRFPIDDLISFALNNADDGSNTMVGLLKNIGLSAKLEGTAAIDLNKSNPTQSSGAINLKFNDALLILSNPMVGLEDQEFKKAEIRAKVESGRVVIDKTSQFISNDLDIGLGGRVDLKSNLAQSQLNVEASIKLGGEIQKVFGWVIGSATKDPSRDSECTIRINGLMSRPNTTIF